MRPAEAAKLRGFESQPNNGVVVSACGPPARPPRYPRPPARARPAPRTLVLQRRPRRAEPKSEPRAGYRAPDGRETRRRAVLVPARAPGARAEARPVLQSHLPGRGCGGGIMLLLIDSLSINMSCAVAAVPRACLNYIRYAS